MSATVSVPARSKAVAITAWIIQALLAFAFLAAAAAKIGGVPMLVEEFDQIGLGQWFRFLVAAVEIIGAVSLLVPGLAGFGAVWLGTTMFFATLTHIFILHSNPSPAVVLFCLNMVLLWLRRDQLAKLRARFVTL
jgi:uncharacterized membrane protein YphA (DoxX/SURF4 family)